MSFQKFVPDNLRTNIIKISSYEKNNPVGSVYNLYLKKDFSFYGLTDLLLCIDQLLDEISVPKSSTDKRQFKIVPSQHLEPVNGNFPEETIATFKLKILFRQNASWQGNLSWVERETEASFRSAFELICLMHSALSDSTSANTNFNI